MKKVIYLALFIGFALTNTSCNSDKKAQAINDFVRAYFPDTEVIANIKDGLDCDGMPSKSVGCGRSWKV